MRRHPLPKLRRTLLVALTAALAATPLAAASAPASASGYRTPVAPYTIGDPGVLYAGGQWVEMATGSWSSSTGVISTASQASGPWSKVGHALLTARPAWASSSDHSIWAPSEVRVDGDSGTRYVVFYAAVIAGETSKRCIGTGISTSPTGPFTPRGKPISCIAGHGASDPEPGTVAADSTIDPTASYVTISGEKRLYLLYKTQHRKSTSDGSKHYYSTIRMARLNISSYASAILGDSHQLTKRTDNPIEENPVLVQRGSTFTLFTSVGGYTTCNYHTEWRQSTHIWSWPATGNRLSFPSNTNTCGTGDAQVIPGLPTDSWRIFFSGRYPAAGDSFKMYVGTVTWSNGTPEVYSML